MWVVEEPDSVGLRRLLAAVDQLGLELELVPGLELGALAVAGVVEASVVVAAVAGAAAATVVPAAAVVAEEQGLYAYSSHRWSCGSEDFDPQG